jgi:hypothetical protein
MISDEQYLVAVAGAREHRRWRRAERAGGWSGAGKISGLDRILVRLINRPYLANDRGALAHTLTRNPRLDFADAWQAL